MMKASIFLLFCLVLLQLSCSTPEHLRKTHSGKKIDTRLAGVWEGSESDNQQAGLTKRWKMIRSLEGTFILEFKTFFQGRISESKETGSWWTEGNLFYEFHEGSGKTDVYQYQILNKDEIKFKVHTMGVPLNNEAYEFIDTRVKK